MPPGRVLGPNSGDVARHLDDACSDRHRLRIANAEVECDLAASTTHLQVQCLNQTGGSDPSRTLSWMPAPNPSNAEVDLLAYIENGDASGIEVPEVDSPTDGKDAVADRTRTRRTCAVAHLSRRGC